MTSRIDNPVSGEVDGKEKGRQQSGNPLIDPHRTPGAKGAKADLIKIDNLRSWIPKRTGRRPVHDHDFELAMLRMSLKESPQRTAACCS
jgi:hypothetical protein